MDNLIYIEPEQRTFETRLEYIKYIFGHKWTQEEIMKASIEHRLNRSYEKYLMELENSVKRLVEKNKPIAVLRASNKEN